MKRLQLSLTSALLVLASSCERVDAPASPAQPLQQTSSQPAPPFSRLDARLHVAHTAVRRLEFPFVSGPGSAFRERIITDGEGRYSIEPLATLDAYTSASEWETFELTQRVREGFLFRYRDFLVRDPQAFARNWSTTELGQLVAVAGRSCRGYRVERASGPSTVFELAVDRETDLVLASREFDGSGQLVAAMRYESFELGPPSGAVAWHVPANEELVLDPEDRVDVRPLEPRVLPAGYVAHETASVSDGEGRDWLKHTYTNGVEPLFFLQAIEGLSMGKAARLDGSRIGSSAGSTSSVIAFQIGSAAAIQGEVAGFDLMAIGKVSQVELLDLIESALP